MRTAAQAELVLDENSESEAVISYLSDLMQRAGRQQAQQQRIVQHQAFLNLPRMVNEDLTQAKEEVISPLPLMHGRPCPEFFTKLPAWTSVTGLCLVQSLIFEGLGCSQR